MSRLSKEERYRRTNLRRSTPEAKEKRRLYDKKRQADPEYRARQALLRNTPERKAKIALYSKRYRSTDVYKEKRKLYRKTQEQQNYRRNYEFKKKFGITIQDYNLILDKQKGVCAICRQRETKVTNGVLRSLAVDHDHKTGKVRGLLCTDCNQTLGHMRENVEYLQNAILYLEENN